MFVSFPNVLFVICYSPNRLKYFAISYFEMKKGKKNKVADLNK